MRWRAMVSYSHCRVAFAARGVQGGLLAVRGEDVAPEGAEADDGLEVAPPGVVAPHLVALGAGGVDQVHHPPGPGHDVVHGGGQVRRLDAGGVEQILVVVDGHLAGVGHRGQGPQLALPAVGLDRPGVELGQVELVRPHQVVQGPEDPRVGVGGEAPLGAPGPDQVGELIGGQDGQHLRPVVRGGGLLQDDLDVGVALAVLGGVLVGELLLGRRALHQAQGDGLLGQGAQDAPAGAPLSRPAGGAEEGRHAAGDGRHLPAADPLLLLPCTRFHTPVPLSSRRAPWGRPQSRRTGAGVCRWRYTPAGRSAPIPPSVPLNCPGGGAILGYNPAGGVWRSACGSPIAGTATRRGERADERSGVRCSSQSVTWCHPGPRVMSEAAQR